MGVTVLNVIVLEEKLALLTHDLRVAEFASSKGLRMLSFLFTTSKCVPV